jgi:hypothetical protein
MIKKEIAEGLRMCPTCHGSGEVSRPVDFESITELSRAVGISKSHASRLFNADPAVRRHAGCSLGTAHRISKELGITMEELCSLLGVIESQTQTPQQMKIA